LISDVAGVGSVEVLEGGLDEDPVGDDDASDLLQSADHQVLLLVREVSRGSGFVQHVGGVHVLVEDTVDGRAEVGVVDVAGLVDAPVL